MIQNNNKLIIVNYFHLFQYKYYRITLLNMLQIKIQEIKLIIKQKIYIGQI